MTIIFSLFTGPNVNLLPMNNPIHARCSATFSYRSMDMATRLKMDDVEQITSMAM